MSTRQRSKLSASSQVPAHSSRLSTFLTQDLSISSSYDDFEAALGPNPTKELINDTNWAEEQARLRRISEAEAEEQEERDYQAAVARSLDLPETSKRQQEVTLFASGSTTSQELSPHVSASYRRQRPPITKQMNSDWMRPFEDNTKKSPVKKRRGANPEHQFRLLFWSAMDEPSEALAVHECPEWPSWYLGDASDVQELLKIGTTERLQFYDIVHSQWVTCLPSYPHQVSKTGHLLLRRMDVTQCLELDKFLAAIKEAPIHMWRNMANERASVRQQIHDRRYGKISVISPLDMALGKRKASEVELCETPPRRHCPSSPISISDTSRPSTPIRRTLFESPVSSSSILDLTTPKVSVTASQLASHSSELSTFSEDIEDEILVPSGKKWPAGMYTIDMARGFRKVDSEDFKRLKLSLGERVSRTFHQDIPRTTYSDQVRFWKRASQQQRDRAIDAGRSEEGLWSVFPRNKSIKG